MSQKFGKCDICDIVLAGQIGSQCDMRSGLSGGGFAKGIRVPTSECGAGSGAESGAGVGWTRTGVLGRIWAGLSLAHVEGANLGSGRLFVADKSFLDLKVLKVLPVP